MTKYAQKCKKCEKQTPHKIFITNRKKGGRLACCICSTKAEHYTNFSLLVDWEDFIELQGGEKNDR